MTLAPLDLKGINNPKKLNIVKALMSGYPLSRSEAASICGVSKVTVGKVAAELIARDLVVAEKYSVGMGKLTEFISPSDTLTALVICLSRNRISSAILDFSENILFECSQSVNSSLPYEASVYAFLQELYPQTSEITDISLSKVAILCEGSLKSQIDLASVINTVSPFETDAILDYDHSCADALCRLYPSNTILLVQVREDISLTLICNKNILPKNPSSITHTNVNRPDSLASHIAELVSPIFKAAMPDRIIIDSDALIVDKAFCEKILDGLARKSRVTRDDLPPIESSRDIGYAMLEALEILKEQVFRELSGIE